VNSVAFSPDGATIVSGSYDKTIKVWDAGTLARLMPHPCSPKLSAPTLATASLELKAGKQSAHSNCVLSVAFSPDGSTIFSGSVDKTIKIWDAVNFRPFNASEWEEVDISDMPSEWEDGEDVMIEGLGYIKENYWRNTVTKDKTIKVWDAGTLAHHICHPAQS